MSTIATTIAGPKTYSAEELQALHLAMNAKAKRKKMLQKTALVYREPNDLSVYAVSAALYHQCSVYAVRRALHNGNEHRAKTSDAGKFRGSIS